MFKFLRKYSLVLALSITAGFLIGFKTFHNPETQPEGEIKPLEHQLVEPTPTLEITPTPKPTVIATPTLSEENIKELLEDLGIDPENPEEGVEKILKELNIDPDNPTEEDFQKILDFLEVTGN